MRVNPLSNMDYFDFSEVCFPVTELRAKETFSQDQTRIELREQDGQDVRESFSCKDSTYCERL